MIPEPLHPAVVHFPIVLGVLAPFFAVGALWAIRRGAAARKAWGVATAILAALTLSSWVAVETGEQQEDRVERVVAHAPFERHEEAAESFLMMTGAVLAVAALGFLGGRAGRVARGVAAAGSLVLVGAGVRVGHSGGELVYRHGAAAVYAESPGARGDLAPAEGPGSGSVRRERRRDDGDGR